MSLCVCVCFAGVVVLNFNGMTTILAQEKKIHHDVTFGKDGEPAKSVHIGHSTTYASRAFLGSSSMIGKLVEKLLSSKTGLSTIMLPGKLLLLTEPQNL